MIAAVCYCLFWGQTIRESQALFSTSQAQTEEALRDQSPYFVKGARMLGIDLFAPGTEESAAGASDLAQKMTRGMYAHCALGALAFLIGAAILVVGLLQSKAGKHVAAASVACARNLWKKENA